MGHPPLGRLGQRYRRQSYGRLARALGGVRAQRGQIDLGESAAVRNDGRSSVAQLLIAPTTAAGLRRLRDAAVSAHREEFGNTENLKLGLQLTHSGRLSHPAPSGDHAPVTVRRHPHLDATLGPPPDQPLLTDGQLYELIDDYAIAADIVGEAGFDFVDLKACHGSLGHELLGAYERPGEFGGWFDNRTRFLRTIVDRVRSSSPDLKLGLRLSALTPSSTLPGKTASGVRPPQSRPATGSGPMSLGTRST